MQNDKKLYIAAGVFLGVGLLFFAAPMKKNQQEPSVSFRQLERLHKETKMDNELQRQKVEVLNHRSAPSVNSGYQIKKAVEPDSGLRLESNKNNAAYDGAEENNAMPTNALDSQTNKLLANKQRYEQMSQVQKKRFIDEYKRNALSMGYKLEVDDQLNITRFERAPAAQPKVRLPVPVDVDQMEEDYDEGEEE